MTLPSGACLWIRKCEKVKKAGIISQAGLHGGKGILFNGKMESYWILGPLPVRSGGGAKVL